jgi:hypothetical protein
MRRRSVDSAIDFKSCDWEWGAIRFDMQSNGVPGSDVEELAGDLNSHRTTLLSTLNRRRSECLHWRVGDRDVSGVLSHVGLRKSTVKCGDGFLADDFCCPQQTKHRQECSQTRAHGEPSLRGNTQLICCLTTIGYEHDVMFYVISRRLSSQRRSQIAPVGSVERDQFEKSSVSASQAVDPHEKRASRHRNSCLGLGIGSVGWGGRQRRQKSSIVSSTYERRQRLYLLLKIRVSVVRFRPWPPSPTR